MHIGLTQQSIGLSSATMVKSVGQRLKDASCRKKEYGNGITVTTNGVLNGVCAKNSSKQHFVAERGTLRLHQPIILSELQKNTVRVIGQYLRELGMNDTVDSLVEESGCRIENPLSMKLRDSIQKAHWQKALEIIEKLRSQLADKQYLTVKVLFLEEKFKEFMQKGEYLMALRLLQIEYPKCKELRPRHEHWATILCTQAFSDQQRNDKWEIGNSAANVLNVLRKVLPPSLMLPPNRLQELLKQSWLYQTKQCDFHGLSREQNIVDDRAILIDHQCSNREFPSKNTSTLYMNAEVWFLKFSPCGKFLASGAKGNQVQIWRMDSPVEIHQNIQINQDIVGVASISWSHDSLYLAVCSTEQANGTGCFIYYVPSGRLVKEYGSAHYSGDSFTSVSFFKDESHKLACAGQKGHFHVYDIHRPEDNVKIFEGFRIRCLYACKDGRNVLAADTHNRIRKYDFDNQREETLIQEASQIMFFTVDKEERYCLVTTKTEGIRLWCLKTITLVRTFFGANHTDFVITSTFGGPDNSFIAAGSEDNSVIIWNLRRSHPIKKLLGHTSTVNCVAWNPVNPRIIASGSDDGTIRIWSTIMDMN